MTKVQLSWGLSFNWWDMEEDQGSSHLQEEVVAWQKVSEEQLEQERTH